MAQNFFYTIESLRVDGNLSANPGDYQGVRRNKRLGRELHAFLRANMPGKLIKGKRKTTPKDKTWLLPHSYVVAFNPTVKDLQFWSGVDRVFVGCNGEVQVERPAQAQLRF
jgi:hypothetical protein